MSDSEIEKELYDVYGGNGLMRIATGVTYEKAQTIVREFELRMHRADIMIPPSKIVRQSNQVVNEDTHNER